MIILPAIDIIKGKAVRLLRGDYEQMTVYNDHPEEVAADFKACGASWIHIVDLEGAKTGQTPNIETVKSIIASSGLKAEVGGGIRSMDVIEAYAKAGVSRVVLGTAAVKDPDFLEQAVKTYGSLISVGVDIKNGFVAIKGWTENSEYKAFEFCKMMQQAGVKTLICTDISRDGAMKGTNLDLYRQLSNELDLDIVASGGVSTLQDIADLKSYGIYGAIIGKAYYTGAIDLFKAIDIAENGELSC